MEIKIIQVRGSIDLLVNKTAQNEPWKAVRRSRVFFDRLGQRAFWWKMHFRRKCLIWLMIDAFLGSDENARF